MPKDRLLLTQSAVDSRITVRHELYIPIVTLDICRILSRLRSRHAAVTRKTAGKPALSALLNRTVNDPSIKPSGKSAKARVVRARSQTRKFLEAFDEFETGYNNADPSVSRDRLIDILIQAHAFDVNDLRVALQSSLLIDPNLKTFLPQAISKLGRYYCVACDLTDAARSSQYTIFGRISVKALEEPVLDTRSITNGLVDFERTLERITRLSHQRQIDHYGSQALFAARTKYQARISNCITPWKIHAEVQLLFFYEHNSGITHPRIICSSKSACYLCDLFFKSHGKFYLPRTHGRLYDKWVLPEWPPHQSLPSPGIQSATNQLNSILEAKILQTLNTKRSSCLHPNKSVLHLREPWSSTSTLPEPKIRQITAEASNSGGVSVPRELEESPSTGLKLGDIGFSSKTAFAKSAVETEVPHATRVTPNTDQSVEGRQKSLSLSDPAVSLLSRGDTLSHKLTHPRDSLVVKTDAITLHASWDWHPMEPAPGTFITQNTCWIQVTWLAHGHRFPKGDQGVASVDLETLDSAQDVIVEGGAAFSKKALSVQKGEHVILIQYSFEGPHCG